MATLTSQDVIAVSPSRIGPNSDRLVYLAILFSDELQKKVATLIWQFSLAVRFLRVIHRAKSLSFPLEYYKKGSSAYSRDSHLMADCYLIANQ